MNFQNKMKILQNNENFFEYTLTDEHIELIHLINEFREKNNMDKLICNKNEKLNEFFYERNSNKNEHYYFIDLLGEFKNKLLKKDENIIKVLLIRELKYIIILEKEKDEYIFIYSNNNEKSNLKVDIEYDEKIFQFYKIHLVNNTIPIVNVKMSCKPIKKYFKRLLSYSFRDIGYQILSLKNDTLIGVLEGPPETPFENGYFLFKMIFPDDYIFKPPQFIFITQVFHPNISENGLVSEDILQDQWSPALWIFRYIILSIQPLLDDPNPDEYLNAKAAKLCKEDKKAYDKIVREYASVFVNYSKFLEDLKNLNLRIETVKKGEKFKYREEEDDYYLNQFIILNLYTVFKIL